MKHSILLVFLVETLEGFAGVILGLGALEGGRLGEVAGTLELDGAPLVGVVRV